jgi:SpoVK/Ycf46/Vps4 family AAA+-type ATPase
LPKKTIYTSKEKAEADLIQRTRTWGAANNLGDQIWSMFINPPKVEDPLEPDNHPIGTAFARSAILYGPPGSSKTTIVRALAGVIGWDFIELHASHFVAEGLPNVQRKADEIFSRLMELDRAIVLFDEIDELVREREKSNQGESDMFGRFLTTSMLPKLAELWDSRKIMYFVATNHIGLFDKAIARSQRFDAVTFVSPPSFEVKIHRLKRLVQDNFGKTVEFTFSASDIDAAFESFRPKATDTNSSAKTEGTLAKFALLRWDELAELAMRVVETIKKSKVDKSAFSAALSKLRDGRWRTRQEYINYLRDQEYERRDCSMSNVWLVEGIGDSELMGQIKAAPIGRTYTTSLTDASKIRFPGYVVQPLGNARLQLTKK